VFSDSLTGGSDCSYGDSGCWGRCRTELHFVRCIKPNGLQVAATFDAPLTLHQLRCCGVLEVTRIARAGYPTRYLHRNFAERYHVLLHGAGAGGLLQTALEITSASRS
jgi:myosin heavy subunit